MACCLIDLIDHCYSKADIAMLETDFPKDLDEIYERLLKNIDLKEQGRQHKGIAQRVLMWLVGATRPLHILELYEAVMIEPSLNQLNEDFHMIDPADLLTACGSLIQSYSDSEYSYKINLVDTLLAENPLGALSLERYTIEKHKATFVRLSHYTVKVSKHILLKGLSDILQRNFYKI